MARGDVLTYFHNRKWHNVIEGDARPFSDHFTKGDAWETGLQEAVRRKVDHVIRNSSGQILERTRYRDDNADDAALAQPVSAPNTPRTPVRPRTHAPQAPAVLTDPRPAPSHRGPNPAVRQVLREIDEEMQGRPAGEILWRLMSRVPGVTQKDGPSIQQLASYAAAIQAGTLRL